MSFQVQQSRGTLFSGMTKTPPGVNFYPVATCSLYGNCYCEAKNCPLPVKLHPGKCFGPRNPKIKVRDTQNVEIQPYCRGKCATDVRVKANLGRNLGSPEKCSCVDNHKKDFQNKLRFINMVCKYNLLHCSSSRLFFAKNYFF